MSKDEKFLEAEEREAVKDICANERILENCFRSIQEEQIDEFIQAISNIPSILTRLKDPRIQQKLFAKLTHHALSDHTTERKVRQIVVLLCKLDAYDCIPAMMNTLFQYMDALSQAGLSCNRPILLLGELCQRIPVFLKCSFMATLLDFYDGSDAKLAAGMLDELHQFNGIATLKLAGEICLLSLPFFELVWDPLLQWGTTRESDWIQGQVLMYVLDSLLVHIGKLSSQIKRKIVRQIGSKLAIRSICEEHARLVILGITRMLSKDCDDDMTQDILHTLVDYEAFIVGEQSLSMNKTMMDRIFDSLRAEAFYRSACRSLALDIVTRALEEGQVMLQPPMCEEDMHCKMLDGPQSHHASILRNKLDRLMFVGSLDMNQIAQDLCDFMGDHVLSLHQVLEWKNCAT